MGDADNDNHARISDQEIQEWMFEVEAEVDDALGRIFSFVNVLNDHYAHTLSVLKSWEKFRLCFNAVNLFVVPVVLSIVMSYFSSWLVDSNSTIEAGLHAIVSILMFLSACVGFPIYAFTLWNAHCADGKTEPERTHSAQWKYADEDGHDDFSTVAEHSSDRLSEVGRMFSQLSQRMRSTAQLVIARRASAQAPQVNLTNAQASIAPTNNGTSESFDAEETTSEEVKLVDIGPEPSSDATVAEMLRREMLFGGTSSEGVPLLILETVDAESSEMEGRPVERSRQLWSESTTTTSPRKGLRDIVVERIDEGSPPLVVHGCVPPVA